MNVCLFVVILLNIGLGVLTANWSSVMGWVTALLMFSLLRISTLNDRD